MGKKEKSNGEGTIYVSARTGLLIGQYVYAGKRCSVYQKKNEKKTDFKKRFNEKLSSIYQGTYIEKSKETLNMILENHIEQKFTDGVLSARSYSRELQTLSQIRKTCKEFIDMPIQDITAEHVERAKSKMREYSKSCIDKMWRLLNKGFKIAYSRRKTPFNIMLDESLTKPLSLKQTKKVEALTVKEEQKLREILNGKERNHKYRNIVLLQLNTGMRIGETLARSLDDINSNSMLIWNTLTTDENGNLILGKHTKIYDKSTGIDKGKRVIPLQKEEQEIIKELKQAKIKNIYNLLFWDYKNNSFIAPYEINSYLYRLNTKYKITPKNLSTHVLRHTRITRLQEAGVHLSVIQYSVGHVEGSSITNDVYTSVDDVFVNNELKKVMQ